MSPWQCRRTVLCEHRTVVPPHPARSRRSGEPKASEISGRCTDVQNVPPLCRVGRWNTRPFDAQFLPTTPDSDLESRPMKASRGSSLGVHSAVLFGLDRTGVQLLYARSGPEAVRRSGSHGSQSADRGAASQWSSGGTLDWWVKERREWLGRASAPASPRLMIARTQSFLHASSSMARIALAMWPATIVSASR